MLLLQALLRTAKSGQISPITHKIGLEQKNKGLEKR